MKPYEVGERVYVRHIGIEKVGAVVKVGPRRIHVEVEIGRGAYRRPKVIVRPVEEVRREPERPKLIPYRG